MPRMEPQQKMTRLFEYKFLNNRYPLLLITLTLFMFGVIEARHPYFFLQDDNRVLFFPLFVDNFRAVASGEFPLFNFHQYLGIPTGIQAHALYLPNYLATGLSGLLLGHYFGTMEILALFHLTVAVLGFYFLTRFFELKELCCCLGALAWTFSAFVITVSNSWIHLSGCAAYLPWILLFSLRQARRFSRVDFAVLMLLKVSLILSAHPQYALYVMTFELMALVLLSAVKARAIAGEGQGLLRLTCRCLLSNTAAAVVSFPALLQGVREAAASASRSSLLSWNDYSDGSYDLAMWLNGLITPFREVGFNFWNDQHFISHIGFIPFVFIIVAAVWFNKQADGRIAAVFFSLALFALLWAGKTPLTGLIYHVPVYNKFRTPFKLVFFTSFFLAVTASFGADWFYKRFDQMRGAGQYPVKAFFVVLLALHVGNMVLLHTVGPQHAFIRFDDRIPLVEPLSDMIGNGGGRIVSAGLDVPLDDEKALPGLSAPLLGYNYASLWGLYHFGGYNALVPDRNHRATLGLINSSVYNLPSGMPFEVTPETFEYFRIWGVRWYVVDARIPPPVGNSFKLMKRDAFRNVFYDAEARPMAYWADTGRDSSIASSFKVNSMVIDVERDSGAELVLNVLYNPKFTATVDSASVPLVETAVSQVAINVPAGRHKVKLTYSDRPFLAGVAISACLSLLAVAFAIFGKPGKQVG